jgi:hypothetical protein
MQVMVGNRRFADLEPAKRLEVLRRLRDIREGRLRLPNLRCGYCGATTLESDRDDRELIVCGACSRRTSRADAHDARKDEITALILDGPQR